MYSAKENKTYIDEFIDETNRSKTGDRTEVFCAGLKVCIDRTRRSIQHYESRIASRVELSKRLPSYEDPDSINSVSIRARIETFGAECIDLTDQIDELQIQHEKYCQAPACPLPKKIKPLSIGPPAQRPQEELSWRKNPLRKIMGMIWPVSFAYYFQKFLELIRWPLG